MPRATGWHPSVAGQEPGGRAGGEQPARKSHRIYGRSPLLTVTPELRLPSAQQGH